MCVVFVCKSASHRSVGSRWLWHGWMNLNWKRFVPEGEELEVIVTDRNGDEKCRNCKLCSHQNSVTEKAISDCVRKYEILMEQCEREKDKLRFS